MRVKLATYRDRLPELYTIVSKALNLGKKVSVSFRDLSPDDAIMCSSPFKALYLQYPPEEIARYMGVPKMELNEREQEAKKIWFDEIAKTKELAVGTVDLVELCNEVGAVPRDFVGDLWDVMRKEEDVDALRLLSDNTGVKIYFTTIELNTNMAQKYSYVNKKKTPIGKPWKTLSVAELRNPQNIPPPIQQPPPDPIFRFR